MDRIPGDLVSDAFDPSGIDFQRARARSFLNLIRSALSGQPRRLLAFD
jgi:hypothetical protein